MRATGFFKIHRSPYSKDDDGDDDEDDDDDDDDDNNNNDNTIILLTNVLNKQGAGCEVKGKIVIFL